MKAEELTISDWVHFKNSLGEEWDGQFSVLDFATGNFLNCKPIPLTAEGLENNGFEWGLTTEQEEMMSNVGVPCTTEKSWVYEDDLGNVVCVNFPNESDGGAVSITTNDKCLSYVWKHEISVCKFQHLLRDCGLTELANNLKPKSKED